MRPENNYALGPLDVFPADIAAAADWRNLLFGGWWSWLEKWGKLVSIFLGIYYLYAVGRWLLTTLFSLWVLYQEHGFGPNLLWGQGHRPLPHYLADCSSPTYLQALLQLLEHQHHHQLCLQLLEDQLHHQPCLELLEDPLLQPPLRHPEHCCHIQQHLELLEDQSCLQPHLKSLKHCCHIQLHLHPSPEVPQSCLECPECCWSL